MKHVFGDYNTDIDPRDDPFHPFTPGEWSQQTSTMLRTYLIQHLPDRIPSTTPGAEPPRDARDSGSARSHSTHLETSSSNRPKMVTYTERHTVPRLNVR